MASSATTLLRKITAEVYDDLADGGAFTLDQVCADVENSAGVEHLAAQLLGDAIRHAAKYVDERRTSRGDDLTLFGDFDRVISLGDGRRRRKGSCRQKELETHVELVAENARRALAAASVERHELELLLPHFATKKATADEALRRYRSNPEAS